MRVGPAAGLGRWLASLCGALLLAAPAHAQGKLHFVGFYYEGPATAEIDCLSQRLVERPVASKAEYVRVNQAFVAAHADGLPVTEMLTAGSGGVVVYSYTTGSGNCTHTAIGKERAATSAEARRQLERNVEANPREFVSAPKILFVWPDGAGDGGSARASAAARAALPRPTPAPVPARVAPAPKSLAPPVAKAAAKPVAKPAAKPAVSDAARTSCADLVAYRDVTLHRIWEQRRKALGASITQLADVVEVKKEFNDDIFMKYAASNWTMLPMILKTAADAIEDVVAMATPSGHIAAEVARAPKLLVRDPEQVYELIGEGRDMLEVASAADAEAAMASAAAVTLVKLSPVANMLKNLSSNLQTFEDFNQARPEILAQFAMVEKVLKQRREQSKQSYQSYRQFQAYVDGVTLYLQRECGPGPQKGKSKK